MKRRIPGRCVYCGVRTRRLACRVHADLLAVDPHYREAREGATPKA